MADGITYALQCLRDRIVAVELLMADQPNAVVRGYCFEVESLAEPDGVEVIDGVVRAVKRYTHNGAQVIVFERTFWSIGPDEVVRRMAESKAGLKQILAVLK